jgi:hypothetical protein
MSVNSLHPEYEKIYKRWDLVRSIVANRAQHLLRVVDPNDIIRSNQYREDAILTNYTRLTKEGLTGLVFRKDSSKEIPDRLAYLEDDATGYRFSLDQLAQKIVGETLETGRYGLLVDYPQANIGQTEKVARIRPYAAESIINWNYTDFGNEYRLSLLVLREQVDQLGEDGFSWVEKCQYRVLFLNNEGHYSQVIYNDEHKEVQGTKITPTDYNGNPLLEIPFTFIGSENNDAWVDEIPLYDMAIVNLGHYKGSADLMETMYMCGQVVPVVNTGEVGEDQWHQANPNGILIGSRAPIVTGLGGSFNFVQAQPNTLPQAVMNDLEKQIAAIGARLIAPPGGRETAEAARIRYGSQNSVLYTITRNISEAIEMALYWASVFMMEVPEQSEYELNDQFYEENADPNLIAQQIMLLDRGAMSTDEIRDNLKRSGIHLDESFVSQEIDPLMGVEEEIPAVEGD